MLDSYSVSESAGMMEHRARDDSHTSYESAGMMESDQLRDMTPLGLWLVRSDSNHRAPLWAFFSMGIQEQIELQAKLLNYFLGSNKSNINQSYLKVMMVSQSNTRGTVQDTGVLSQRGGETIHCTRYRDFSEFRSDSNCDNPTALRGYNV